FPDGTRMRRAFSYEWRLWHLPEALDLLREAGFPNPVVYWEGTGKDGKGNGIYRPSKVGDDATAWVAYIVAAK
ncbi:MAG TPA: class I SAM-dependent methyltransferase, partial [Planctomycetota bacterium]|nr:class I SAM-dependent methyltransferase [Planctomycetota bacterium]